MGYCQRKGLIIPNGQGRDQVRIPHRLDIVIFLLMNYLQGNTTEVLIACVTLSSTPLSKHWLRYSVGLNSIIEATLRYQKEVQHFEPNSFSTPCGKSHETGDDVASH